MASEKLQKKMIERSVQKFATSISGIINFEVITLDNDVFARHRKAIDVSCGIDSTPMVRWSNSSDESIIVKFLCSRIAKFGMQVYIPCELPFVIRVEISDCLSFLQSIWKIERTKDLTLYITSPDVVIQLQDLEYDFAYFEIVL